jgi:hypothetical protein
MISHLRGEVSTSYFTLSTPLGSIITQRKIIGSSCPDNMHIYCIVQSFKSLRPAVSEEKWAQDFVTDGQTESTKTICLPQDGGDINIAPQMYIRSKKKTLCVNNDSSYCWHYVCRFKLSRDCTVLRPAQEYFTYMETSPLPVKGCKI